MCRPPIVDSADFSYLRTHHCFYIDKTDFLREWWHRGSRVTLLLRPHGFGKTLAANTLARFFSSEYTDQNELFSELSVWQDDKTRAAAGRYPVLSLSFADWTGTSFDKLLSNVRRYFLRLREAHPFLTQSPLISETLHRFFSDFSEESSVADIQYFLQWLCKALELHFGIKPIVILDDYDTPFLNAWHNHYAKDLAGFMDPLMGLTFRSTQSLTRAVIFSTTYGDWLDGIDLADVVTSTNAKFATGFGFTEAEVSAGLQYCGLSDTNAVQKQYGGFSFGCSSHLCHPKSVARYLSHQTFDHTDLADPLLETAVCEAYSLNSAFLLPQLRSLLSGKTLFTEIREPVTYSKLTSHPGNLFSLLVAYGIATIIETENPVYRCRITLPNEESRLTFRRLFSKHLCA